MNGGIETLGDFGADGQQDTKTITSGISESLISVDMTAPWDWKTNVCTSQNLGYLGGSVEGFNGPINVHDASLCGGKNDSTTIHMFGGTTSSFNKSFRYFEVAPTTQYAMWSYYTRYDTWLAINTSDPLGTIASWGASTAVSDMGLAFFVGGQIESGTVDTTQYLCDETIGISGTVVINTTTNHVQNFTVDESIKSNRQGGQILHFPGSLLSEPQRPLLFLGPPRLQSRVLPLSRPTQTMSYLVVPLLGSSVGTVAFVAIVCGSIFFF
ncbi:hypothetical protein RBB50_012400 [Rhinocladiella similis]